MGKPIGASVTPKDQVFTDPATAPIPGDWKFELVGPDARVKMVADVSQPIVFLDVQPGSYTVAYQRMAKNGVDTIGDRKVSDPPLPITADVVIAVADGITAQIIQQTR